MDKLSIFRATGLAVGLVVGIIICVIVFRYMNKDKKVITKYDERQEVTRGRAYKYAFWASMGAAALVMIMEVAGVSLASSFTKYFFIVFVGIIVHVAYSIWNDAYVGINTNKKRFMIVCILAGLANLLGVIGNIKGGTFIVDGMVSDAGSNLLCVILMAFAGIELFIKDRMDKDQEVVEESED
jgi:hypothetical protein